MSTYVSKSYKKRYLYYIVYTLQLQTLKICRVYIIENFGYFDKNQNTSGFCCKPRFYFSKPVLNSSLTRAKPVFNPYQTRILVLVWKTSGFHRKPRVFSLTLRFLRVWGRRVHVDFWPTPHENTWSSSRLIRRWSVQPLILGRGWPRPMLWPHCTSFGKA